MRWLKGLALQPFQLNADRVIVAIGAAPVFRPAGMPCPVIAADKLPECAIAPDIEVGRDLQSPDLPKVGVCVPVQLVGEQRLHLVAAVLAGRQRSAGAFHNQLDASAHPYFEQLRGLQVSAHFYIRRDGQLWQFVSCDDRAWHAGASQYRGRSNCNDDSIGIELEGLEGELFEDAQYTQLAALCAAIGRHYPIAHVAGHEHIAPGRKQDPGPGFDWPRLAAALDFPNQCFP